MNWVVNAALGGVCLGIMALLVRYTRELGIGPANANMYVMGFAVLGFLATGLATGAPVAIPRLGVCVLALAAVPCLLGNWLMTRGSFSAPNPGYAIAFLALMILTVVAGGFLFFPQPGALQWSKLLGIVFACLAVVFLSI